jgi:tetratricopeptide (TPR) repeat protein
VPRALDTIVAVRLWYGAALASAALAQVDPTALIPLYQQALSAREQQFGPQHPKVARSASDLGLYLLKMGQREPAAAALRRALEIDSALFPDTHPAVAEDRENLASALPPSAEMAALLEQASRCTDTRIAARVLSKLGSLQEQSQRLELATASYRKALALEETAARLNDLALVLEPKAAEPLLRKALARRQRESGPRHPETAIAMNNLCNALLAQRKLSEAEPLQRAALTILEEALGREHPRVGVSCANLAEVARAKGNAAGAKALYRRALTIDEKTYGPAHPEVIAGLENLAGYLSELGEAAEAAQLRKRVEAIKAGATR